MLLKNISKIMESVSLQTKIIEIYYYIHLLFSTDSKILLE